MSPSRNTNTAICFFDDKCVASLARRWLFVYIVCCNSTLFWFLVCVCCSSFVRVKVKGQVSGLAVCMVDEEPRIQDAAKVFFHKYSEVSLVLTTHTPTHPQTCACAYHVFCLTFSQNRAS